MDSIEGRIVVMPPGTVAAGAVVRGSSDTHEPGKELIAGHPLMLFVARGEGTYRVQGRTGILRPNTLLVVPAGTFACELDDEREMYVVAVREPTGPIDGKETFAPFIERRLSASDGRRFKARMAEFTGLAEAGLAGEDDVEALRSDIMPFFWRREPNGARETISGVLKSIWEHLAEPLTLEALATNVGYTANYLNDLARDHTGRPLGGWIADMRMARARAALERTDLPVAEIGAACGYDDPAYFSRVFRRAHGVPPATWRIAKRPFDERYLSVALPVDELHAIEQRRSAPERAYSFAS